MGSCMVFSISRRIRLNSVDLGSVSRAVPAPVPTQSDPGGPGTGVPRPQPRVSRAGEAALLRALV